MFVTVAIENIPAGWRGRETYEFANDDEFLETFALARARQGLRDLLAKHFRRKR